MEKLSGNIKVTVNENLIKQMKEAYLACPAAVKYINSLKIEGDLIDKNIEQIYDFVCDVNYCKKCPGMDNCKKENPLLVTKVFYEDGMLFRRMSPCKEFINRIEFLKQFAVRDFPDNILNSKLTTIDKTNERKMVVNKYNEFVNNGVGEWIYICGEVNTGRSFLAATLCVDACKRKMGPVCFLNTSKRIKELNNYSYKNQDKFNEIIDLYSSCPILVFDDFGNEYKNDFIRDGIVFEILSKRSANHLFTIFTSDFKIDEIEMLYNTSKAGSIRAKQISKLIKSNSKEEINLGEISAY